MHSDNYASMSVRRKTLLVPSYTLVGLNVGTGAKRWRNADDVVFGRLVTTPVVAGDAIYAGADDNGVYKFAPDGAKQWRYQTDNVVCCDPAVAGGIVWVGSDDGSLYGLDPASGEAAVVQQIGSPVVWATASTDRVVCVTESGLRAFGRGA
ncbi:MAG: PQQ-binding-like beta-propeller repeat protein [Haloarculaceae archaeon]